MAYYPRPFVLLLFIFLYLLYLLALAFPFSPEWTLAATFPLLFEFTATFFLYFSHNFTSFKNKFLSF